MNGAKQARFAPAAIRAPAGIRALPAIWLWSALALAPLVAWPAHVLAAGELILLPPGGAAEYDERFVDGLRSRGLFDLAEKYCRDRLARTDLPEAERGAITIELARTLTARAVESPPAARAPLGREAERVINAQLQIRSRDPRALPLALQRAMVSLALGELGRQEAEVGGLSTAALEPARAALRDAVGQLKLLDERIALELQRRSRAPRAAGRMDHGGTAVARRPWPFSAGASLSQSGAYIFAR